MTARMMAIIKGLWGLFVDDGVMAFSLLAWCAFLSLAVKVMGLPNAFGAPLLCMGCVAILAGSVIAAARRKRSG